MRKKSGKVVLKLCFKRSSGTSLVVQWLRLHTLGAGGVVSIPGWGTEISQAVQCSQKKEKKSV